ncbi:MAG: two-component system nitrogen regulation response regulator GlnG [Psychrosphaera sp.]|jgi:two-component system nitrogen regulation response regulator GlnG|uniref:nitrogen regulation protein NR(I) n=1 Tax=Psychrosphaera sp. F3M07 TaxID=2841560 RepID=UPI001C0960AB|nr:nitrogen regulation protein NR(I) [Psychrosphaera sp. F3M07]MBU2919324.1 nitrogen regulation protein NR(I) [Psychrosphaera sp. F3M07]
MNRVWIVDDDNSIRWVLEKALSQAGFEVESFASANMMLQRLDYDEPDTIISDIRMPEMDGMELLDKLQVSHPNLPIIIMTAHSDLDSAVNAYQQGAFEYLPKPFDIDEAIALAKRAVEHSKKRSSKKKTSVAGPVSEIIGEAPAMQEVFRAIGRLSRSSVSVLINGQSGTGKELVAHALHKHSPRKDNTFVALNMAAIPKELIESELFGHEKGAFTGAASTRKGRFEQANNGTLFLDEIGDMPLDIQTRLLRVLADGQFYRVGGHEPVSVDVRIVAATHQNLENLVEQGQFREDLFHRLNVIRIHIPALKDRKEDIPQLCEHFLIQAAKELSVESKQLSKPAAEFLSHYAWPGNVRQLENTCRWLTVMASGKDIIIDDLPPEILDKPMYQQSSQMQETSGNWVSSFEMWLDEELSEGKSDVIKEAQANFERALIEISLRHTKGHKQEAAKRIGWGRNTITRKMQELDMN